MERANCEKTDELEGVSDAGPDLQLQQALDTPGAKTEEESSRFPADLDLAHFSRFQSGPVRSKFAFVSVFPPSGGQLKI